MQRRDTQYLEHILDYCNEIAHDLTVINSSYDTFLTEPMAQRSLAFCILQIGELVGKLSDELRLLLAKSTGRPLRGCETSSCMITATWTWKKSGQPQHVTCLS